MYIYVLAVLILYFIYQQVKMNRQKEVQQFSKLLITYQKQLLQSLENLAISNSSQNQLNTPNQSHNHNEQFSYKSSKSVFDLIPQIQVDQATQNKIFNLKLVQFTPKRKDQLFKRNRRDQEDRFITRRRQIQKKYAYNDAINKGLKAQFTLISRIDKTKVETFPVKSDDLDKLKPQCDLNDQIITNYLKLLRNSILPQEMQQISYFYNSYFFAKLLGQITKDETIFEKDLGNSIHVIRDKLKQNFKNVKRWSKKTDIFQKKIIVFPINAFHHWFCVLVLNAKLLIQPNGDQTCQIIYCDSMFQKKQIVTQAIKVYLQCELEEKKNKKVEVKDLNVSCYQLLIPRQTNNHDCGLYMLEYIEMLLMKKQQLLKLKQTERRKKLNLFPRILIYSMRDRLRKLFVKMTMASSEQQKLKILNQYTTQTNQIINQASKQDYDEINQAEYNKYQKMNRNNFLNIPVEERTITLMIKFYLDPEVNFYQRDR